MNKIKDAVKKSTKKLVKQMVVHDKDVWPPICTSFAYQPQRPEVATLSFDTKKM